MAKATNKQTFMTGALIAAVSLTTAWAVGRDPRPASSVVPMDAALANVAEERIKTTWDLPVTRNENVDTWIDFLAGGNRERTQLWMERSGRYTPMIREQLRARNMPEDLPRTRPSSN